MKYDQNLHTHSIYCDGKNTLEETVYKAIELGFDSIGFSGHAPMNIKKDWVMTKENRDRYISEVKSLKSKFDGKIKIYLGLENDLFSGEDLSVYDYVISSVHFLEVNGETVEFDCDKNTVKQLIDRYFEGNGLKYAKRYYETFAKINTLSRTDIVGHCDIVTKHSEKEFFFDTESKQYQSYALEGITAVAEKNKVFEVNTGAIARGYRTTPYPAPFIMKRLKELGAKMIISSDCHNKEFLDCKFDDAVLYVKSFGFDKIYKFVDGEFVSKNV
ncbi:MAG: histidinol-phosphatase HisJ family protein [Clostridiales bacterium]|nr:histidinol-phosphatase HisJ family protein [Clostridiales bacterium]